MFLSQAAAQAELFTNRRPAEADLRAMLSGTAAAGS
jgi:hypothetical protein